MDIQDGRTVAVAGSVTITADSAAELPVMIHKDTPIGEIDADLSCGRYIFATNDAGRIVGLVSSDEIQTRLRLANERERTRWSKMPLASLLSEAFPVDVLPPGSPPGAALDCTVLVENGKLAGLVTEDDVFLGWRRLAGVVSGAASDSLTGLMSRLAYERRLHEEWNRAGRTGCSIGVVMIDLDHFKDVNDRYGHAEGDRVLRDVASALEQSLRSYDILARYGGDEFVALCLGCRPGQVEIPIRRMLKGLRGARFAAGTDLLPLTASIGAAVRHDGFSESRPPALFDLADRCLYRAKETRDSAAFIDVGSDWQKEQWGVDGAPVVTGPLTTAASLGEVDV